MVTLFFLFFQQLEDERQKARDSHYERINAIHKLQDESKEMHDKEMEVLKNRLLRVSTNDFPCSPFVLQYIMYAYFKARLFSICNGYVCTMCYFYPAGKRNGVGFRARKNKERIRRTQEEVTGKLQHYDYVFVSLGIFFNFGKKIPELINLKANLSSEFLNFSSIWNPRSTVLSIGRMLRSCNFIYAIFSFVPESRSTSNSVRK